MDGVDRFRDAVQSDDLILPILSAGRTASAIRSALGSSAAKKPEIPREPKGFERRGRAITRRPCRSTTRRTSAPRRRAASRAAAPGPRARAHGQRRGALLAAGGASGGAHDGSRPPGRKRGATAIRNTISIRAGNYHSNERSQFPLGVMPSGDARWKLILDVSDADFLTHSGQSPDRPSACPQGMWSRAPRWSLFDMPAGSARAVASTVDRGTDVAPAACVRRLRRTRRRRSAAYLPLEGT